MKISELNEALPYLFKARQTPLIIGRHGIGKSQSIKKFALDNGYEFIDLRLGQMSDAGDILGLPEILKDKDGRGGITTFMRPGFLPTKGRGIILLDEINRAHKDIMQAVFQLILDKRIHEYVLPADWHVIAAANPNTKDYDTSDFVMTEKAFQDRFVHIKLEPSVDEYLAYAKTAKFNPHILSFVSEHTNFINTAVSEFSYDYISGSNRTIESISKLENLGMPEKLLEECMFGMWGVEKTTSYLEHKRSNMNKVKAVEVLNNYKKVKAKVLEYSRPEESRGDILTVICNDLRDELLKLKEVNSKQVNNLKEFLLDLPKDNKRAAIVDLTENVPFLVACKEFSFDQEFIKAV